MEGLKGEKLKLVVCGGLKQAQIAKGLVYLARNFELLSRGLEKASERFIARE